MTNPLPVVYPTPVHMLLSAAAKSPDNEALKLDDASLSYREYVDAVAALAEELREYGVRGERVATLLPNGLDTCIASYAAWAAGAQLVPLNPLYTERELVEILADAKPVVFIFHSSRAALCRQLAASLSIPTTMVVGSDARAFTRVPISDYDLAANLPLSGDLAILQYTGGTTGRAKGVDLSHRAISTNVSQREAALPSSHDGERVLCAMPLFHAYGFSMALLLVPFCKGTLVIRERYHPVDLLEQFARERITAFPGAPTIFNGLVAHENFRTTDFSSLNVSYSGSAPLAVETMQTWEEVTGSPIHEGYGQTEAGPVISFNQVGKQIKAGTVGTPVIDTRIKLVDTRSGEVVSAPGEVGEICVRGPQLMTGYRGLAEETACALRDGWLHTGDLGFLDADGYLTICDRLKDMVIVGGYNVYPREVDEVLFTHPDIVDAASVGSPDSYRGEVIRAFVIPRDDADISTLADRLNKHCSDRLAPYKCPASIDMVDALPKTTVNKSDKVRLREIASERYPPHDKI